MQNKHVLIYAVEAKLEALCIKMVEKGADVNAKYVSSICSPSIRGPQLLGRVTLTTVGLARERPPWCMLGLPSLKSCASS